MSFLGAISNLWRSIAPRTPSDVEEEFRSTLDASSSRLELIIEHYIRSLAAVLNMVPPYSGTPGGVTAVIEYAVMALKVKHTVVCGHSDCGAMKGLLHPESTKDLPTVRYWFHHGQAALMVSESMASVLMQLVHLRTHPSVAGAMARADLTLSGWVYDIGEGVVRIAEEGKREFVPVTAGIEV